MTAGVLAIGGLLKVGAVSDLVSKPVMTGFLFGLGLTIAVGQLPKVLGVPDGSGDFFPRVSALIGDLGSVHVLTAAVGLGSIALLIALRRFAPSLPGILIVLVTGIVISALFGFDDHGVDVVGRLPSGVPQLAVPDVSWHEAAQLIGPALGVMLLTTEAVGVARALATQDGYAIAPSRELVALGCSNLSRRVVGVRPVRRREPDRGGREGRRPVPARLGRRRRLVLLTGAFLAPLFKDLPQATLGAIVVVAVAGFFNVAELRRFARLRRSAIVLALVALGAVLVLGVLPGLITAALVSLVLIVQMLSRPPVDVLARDPSTGWWGRHDIHADWETSPGVLVVTIEGPLWYGNSVAAKDRVLAVVAAADPPPRRVVLELLTSSDLDVQGLDTLAELAGALERDGVELRLAGVSARVRRMLERGGLAERVPIDARLDDAVSADGPRTPSPSRPSR